MKNNIFILPIGGESIEKLSLNITENGSYSAAEGTAYTEVNVSVPDIPAVTEPLNVTENGTYTAPEGVDGFSEVVVSVPKTDTSVVSSVVQAAPVSFTALDVVIKVGSNKTMTSYGVDYSTDNFQNYQSVTKAGTYFGEKTITIPNLTSGTTYQVRSFVVVDGVRYDQEPFNTIATASIPVYPESVPAKATMMTTTDLSSSKYVTMGYGSTAMPDENFYVDWGDGSEIQLYNANTSYTVTHTYSETGNKTIYCWSDSTTDTEYGKMPPFCNSYSGSLLNPSWRQIESIDTPLQKIYGGSTHYTANSRSLDDMFREAKQLKIVCSDLFENYCDTTKALASSCYNAMFYGCSALTVAPELPATTLAQNCYYQMFHGCTSLTTAPELPATTLPQSCYGFMFYGCKSLTEAPELPATTLAQSCYYQMFYGCSNLQSVTTYCVNWNTNYTQYWLQNAGTNATNPTVYCPADSTIPSGSNSGIPTGWTRADLVTE